MKTYGFVAQKESNNEFDLHLEKIQLKGFTILKSILSKEIVRQFQSKTLTIYEQQAEEFGREKMRIIKDENLVRMPLAFDPDFTGLLKYESINQILDSILGKDRILHLQNAIISKPNIEHRQRSWHRDLPYQNYTISSPLAINVFFCLSEFSPKTGATILLPFSHRMEQAPSETYFEENHHQVAASAGDVIIFDSMLFHKAGFNTSTQDRIGVNHVFSKAIIQQQISLPDLLQGKFSSDPFLSQLLGYRFRVAKSVLEYREAKFKKQKNA